MLAPIDADRLGALGLPWFLLMEFGLWRRTPGLLAYPLLPWFGAMCLGYGLGFVFTLAPPRRTRVLVALGASAVLLFVLLRALNGYGDQVPWRSFPDVTRTVMSFLNVSKYPPSLLYMLVTLGVSCLLLPILERVRGPLSRALLAFGRTPLFTYMLHIWVAHSAALLIGVLTGVPAAHFFNFIVDPSGLVRAKWGFTLTGVYIAWLAVLALLYPLASWFAEVKRRRRDWWLSYI